MRSDDLKKFHDAPMKVSTALHNCFPSLANYLKFFLDKEKRTDTNCFRAEILSVSFVTVQRSFSKATRLLLFRTNRHCTLQKSSRFVRQPRYRHRRNEGRVVNLPRIHRQARRLDGKLILRHIGQNIVARNMDVDASLGRAR